MADPRQGHPVVSVVSVVSGISVITADNIARLAERVRRLSPSHRDPERFHQDKSEIAAELRRLAREIAA